MKRIGKTGVQISLVLVLALSLALGTAMPEAKATVGNDVDLDFSTAYWHTADGDLVVSVDNVLLPGSLKSTVARIENRDDTLNELVTAPRLTFTTGLPVEFVSPQYFVPDSTYEWQFENIGEGEWQRGIARISADFSFTPGFSASRTLSQIEFTTPGVTETQTLTIEATPVETMDELSFFVRIMDDDLVNATITSATGDGDIDLSPDRLNVTIADPVIGGVGGNPYTQEVKIAVELKQGVTSASFKPRVYVIASHDTGYSGDPEGDTVTREMERDGIVLGTWQWETENPYSWHWTEQQINLVMFPHIERNWVHAGFETTYSYWTEGNSVDNPTTDQPTRLHSYLHNRDDDTDGVVDDPVLELSTTQPVTDVKSDYLVSTDPYRWEFPDIVEDESFRGDARLAETVPVTTGFDVKRIVNQTTFPYTGGTQILTVSVTPKEAMDRLEVHGSTDVSGLDIATVTSVTGEGIGIHDDGRGFHVHIWEPALKPYQWEIEITIGPLPSEYPQVDFEFMPKVDVENVDFIDSGSSSGSSLSGKTWSLDGGAVLGTWEWQATGDYSWWWSEEVSKNVHMEGYAEIQCNRVHAGFGTEFTYRTACDSVDNIFTTEYAWIGTNLHNRSDGILGVVYDPVLELSTDQTVTDVKSDYLVSTDPYRWELPPIEQDQGFDGYAKLTQTEEFWTGFSVERSVDETTFLPSGGTQVLTLTVTPKETMERLELHGHTRVAEGLEVATFTSISGEGDIHFKPGGYDFGIGIDNPIVDPSEPYEWTITIDIGSLPPEYLALEYMPSIFVRNVHVIPRDDFYGSSLSGESYALDGTTLGIWTWKATGDYFWNWEQKVSKDVQLEGYAVPVYPAPTQDAINEAIDDGLAWLRTQQQPDGSWYWGNPGEPEQPSVGMTGLSVWSLIHGLVPQTDPQVQAGIDFILSQQRLDPNSDDYGAVYIDHPTYETAIAILALRATNNPVYLDEMTLAAEYLARSQNDEGVVYPHFPDGCSPDNPAYGGWSYGYGQDDNRIHIGPDEWIEVDWYVRADLSCTQFAMIGLKAAEEAGVVLSHDTWSEVWRKAEIYVTRCQNPDGGFTYQPQDMPGGGGNSYGSMTAGGVWCLALSGVPVEDTRVQDGLAWLDSNYFYDRNPPGGTHNHYYFLWSAAKAFTHYGPPPVLEGGTWYCDYAGYLLANQDASGQWINPYWGPDPDGDRESNLNRTQYALLILERAVLPPPPGIDLIGIELDHMKILFDRSPNRDKFEIKARLWLEEGASYDLTMDIVRVTIDGVVITIPAGSFAGSAGKYEFKSAEGVEPKVGMKLDFNKGHWSLKVEHTDASAVDNRDGVTVALVIGDMFTGQVVFMWCNDLVYP